MSTATAMTSRERWLAAAQMQPVDRLPFWPKLNGSYPRAQTEPFREMSINDTQEWIGSDNHIWAGRCTKEVRTRTSHELSSDDTSKSERFVTPNGTLTRLSKFDAGSQAWHPVDFPVKTLDDIHVMTEWLDDVQVELDEDSLGKAHEQVRQIGEDAVTTTGIGVSALMDWVEHLAGVENAHLLLADYPDDVATLFEARHRSLCRTAEIHADKWPGDFIYSVENTSTTLTSPAQFEQYCHPHLKEYGEIITGVGRIHVLHMCGHLKVLLPLLNTLPAQVYEAFTAPTLGDTTLLDGRTSCPEKCLVGGTQATWWIEPADAIIARIEAALDELPHHRGIVVTSAGVMPPLCEPETIKTVCEWVQNYPARM
jgi:uroporphyrinogen-III decarboxylase